MSIKSVSRSPWPLALVAAILLQLGGTAGADRIVLLDGSERELSVAAIDGQGRVRDDQAAGAPVDLFGLRTIDRQNPAPVTPSIGTAVLCMCGGGNLIAQKVTIAGQECLVDWQYGQQVRLPLSAVRGLVLAPTFDNNGSLKLDPAFARSLESEGDQRDTLFASKAGKLVTVPGLIKELNEQALTFTRAAEAEERQVPRANLYGMTLAAAGLTSDLSGQCLVQLRDGSSLWGAVIALKDGTLHMRIGGGLGVRTTTGAVKGAPVPGDLEIPWDAVTRLDVRSPRMIFASDLKPVSVVQEGLVTLGSAGSSNSDEALPYRRDLSVAGHPLKAGGKVFEKGLGVHATSKITYELAGKYDTFAATIVLDPPLPGKGDCLFVVLADGQERFRREVNGSDPPQSITVSIAGARQVTLAVLDGADWNLAGHANWCDARFIR